MVYCMYRDAGAVTAQNDGAGVFTLSRSSCILQELQHQQYILYNGGPADPANPWASEGKDDDGAGDADFMVDVAALRFLL